MGERVVASLMEAAKVEKELSFKEEAEGFLMSAIARLTIRENEASASGGVGTYSKVLERLRKTLGELVRDEPDLDLPVNRLVVVKFSDGEVGKFLVVSYLEEWDLHDFGIIKPSSPLALATGQSKPGATVNILDKSRRNIIGTVVILRNEFREAALKGPG